MQGLFISQRIPQCWIEIFFHPCHLDNLKVDHASITADWSAVVQACQPTPTHKLSWIVFAIPALHMLSPAPATFVLGVPKDMCVYVHVFSYRYWYCI